MPDYFVHLVGSVPLADAEAVFTEASRILGPALKRIPDGETGDRADWLGWMGPMMAANKQLEPTGETFAPHSRGLVSNRFKPRDGIAVADLRFENFRYADAAIASWRIFERLQTAGTIPAGVRFQVSLAHPISIVRRYFPDELHVLVEPVIEQTIFDEIARMAEVIPHDRLAIQWDCASAIFDALERETPTRFGATRAEMFPPIVERLVRAGQHVPQDVELLYHLCYGDSNHRHSVEPADLSLTVEMANRVTAALDRPIALFHMPVPRRRDDDAYFAPLDRLTLMPGTEISVGAIHYTDGAEGTRRRLAAAHRHLDRFMIATECGFGRRPPETVPDLLRICAEVAGVR